MIDANDLMDRAMSLTGLNDFGTAPLRAGLDVFCKAICEEAGLNAAGMAGVEKLVLDILSERLRIEACLKAHPEILDQRLLRSIFVVGMPRTGSTALSQFLSEDPGARSIRRWESASITPPPDAGIVDDPRIAITRRAFAARDAAMPAFRAMLPIEAEDPSEHGVFLYFTFQSYQFATLYHIPSYLDWLYEADMDPAYAFFEKALKILQWKTPGTHWNLKHPLDLFSLPSVARVFPEATFVWTHRDPAVALTSFASLTAMLRRGTVGALDEHAMMDYLLRFETESLRRGLSDRPVIGEQRFVDFSQAQLSQDAPSAIRGLYAKVGLPFTTDYEGHLRDRIAARPRGGHGRHSYDASTFGFTAEQLRAPVQDYVTRFAAYL